MDLLEKYFDGKLMGLTGWIQGVTKMEKISIIANFLA